MSKGVNGSGGGLLLRLYLRLLLACYPPSFRERCGDEYLRLLLHDLAQTRGRHKAGFLLSSSSDALSGGLRLRLGWRRFPAVSPSNRRHSPGRHNMLDQLHQDFAYALRNLVRRPGWTLAAVATLALGIGATTAVFSMVNDVLLRPLPYPQADRLVQLRAYQPDRQRLREVVSYPLCQRMGEAQEALEDFGCWAVNSQTVEVEGGAHRLLTGIVNWQVLKALRAQPLLGRSFNARDDHSDAARVALLSYGFWQEHFGGDAQVVGKILRVEEIPYTIVGVMERDFLFPDRGPRLWVSMAGRPRTPNINWLRTLGRLKEEWTREQAWAHFEALRLQVSKGNDGGTDELAVRPVSLMETLVGEVRPQLWLFLSAVAAVLLIACINVANLLLSRMAGREREMALRSALGAGRGRLLAQMLSETTLLGLLGGAGGMAVAFMVSSAVHSMASDFVPRSHLLGMDAVAFFFAGALSLLVGLLIGILPALRSSRPDLSGGLQEGSRGTAGSLRHHRLRAALVVAQIALAAVLLVNAGLLLRSLQRLASTEVGFETADLLMIRPSPPLARYRQPESMRQFYADLLQRVRGLPLVEAASMSAGVPFGGVRMSNQAWPQGGNLESEGETVDLQVVDENFFAVLGIGALQGRLLDSRDRPGAPPAAVVNETLARRLFGEDAVGQHLLVGRPPRRVEIVGVVPDLRLYELTGPLRPMVFEPLAQHPEQAFPDILARTSPGHAAHLASEVRNLVHSLDPGIPLVGLPTLQDELRGRTANARFRTLLLGAFGITALLLAVIGVYGVVAYGVAQRTREIGVRMALGARRLQVLSWVVRRGLLLTAAGLLLGLAGALATSQLLESYLHQLSVHDRFSYAAALLLLFVAAFLAAYLPARRASRTDPMEALRCE
ncbi:MAG TPA: ABC transporter permease [Acidobacteriota bacterium]|nr:ABC transporter permease [Acidobacteriota bacterium]